MEDPLALLQRKIEGLQVSQKDLADKWGCTQSQVSRVLRGQRPVSLKIAVAIEQQFGIPTTMWVSLEN